MNNEYLKPQIGTNDKYHHEGNKVPTFFLAVLNERCESEKYIFTRF